VNFDKEPEFLTITTKERSWRVGRLGSNEFTLVIGLSTDATAAELRQLRNAAAITLPIALLLIGLGGWVVAGRALRPLRRIAETASSVTSRGLDQRVPALDGDPEITRLVDMLNGMMDRLEIGFRQATRFSADASHELKTPLAIMRGELEQAVQRAAPGSDEQRTLNSLLEETHRLGSIIRSLLLLSRADAGRLVTTHEVVDLTHLVGELVDDASVSAEAAGIHVASEITPGIRVSGDADLLRTAILNLLVNAQKHNQPGGSVTVRLARQEGLAILEITNTGAAIAQEERHDIFERFHRGRDARDHAREGVGLGLSLAREIIAGHNGSLTLAEDRGDGLVRFTATLPPI
jgi:signal transduction histidine kinase